MLSDIKNNTIPPPLPDCMMHNYIVKYNCGSMWVCKYKDIKTYMSIASLPRFHLHFTYW